MFYLAIGTGANTIRAYISHMIPFLIQKQVYTCHFTEETANHDLCTRENICEEIPEIVSWDVDW